MYGLSCGEQKHRDHSHNEALDCLTLKPRAEGAGWYRVLHRQQSALSGVRARVWYSITKYLLIIHHSPQVNYINLMPTCLLFSVQPSSPTFGPGRQTGTR